MESLLEFAALGVYCQFDLFGTECSFYQLNPTKNMPSDAQRIENIAALVQAGYEDRCLMSHDIHTKHRLVITRIYIKKSSLTIAHFSDCFRWPWIRSYYKQCPASTNNGRTDCGTDQQDFNSQSLDLAAIFQLKLYLKSHLKYTSIYFILSIFMSACKFIHHRQHPNRSVHRPDRRGLRRGTSLR